MEPRLFFQTYGPAILESTRGTAIFPSVKMAQAALETGYGKSIRKAGFNFFGIKSGSKYKGPVISNTTREVLQGVSKYFTGSGKIYPSRSAAIAAGEHYQTLFRAYPSYEASIRDHSSVLLKDFKPALLANTPEEQTQLLEDLGYATDKGYNEALNSIIRKYNLKEWDQKKSL